MANHQPAEFTHKFSRRPKNIEASVLLEGTVQDRTIAELCTFVQRSWSEAQRIDSKFLYAYSAQYRSKQHTRDELSKFIPIRQPHDLQTGRGPHEMSWAEYVRKLRTTPRKHPLRHRLDVLHRARDIFAARRQFADMSEEDRKLVAGTLGRVRAIQKDGVDYNLFGNMGGNGAFAQIVNRSPALLSKALDQIPLSGPISKARFDSFAEIFLSAFESAERKGGLPTATRLLAMKRPDTFVCLNAGNREDLCHHFGTAPMTTDLTNYWDRIVEPMMTTEWWQASMPSAPLEQDIWNGRAALLDVIYFKGKE